MSKLVELSEFATTHSLSHAIETSTTCSLCAGPAAMPSEVTQASTTNVPNEKADTEAITTGRCHASDLVLGNGVRLVLGSTLKIGRFTVTSLIEACLQPNENLLQHRSSCMAPTVSNTTIISNSAVKGFPLLKLKPPALAASMKSQKPKRKRRSNSASKEKKGQTEENL